MSIRFQSVGTFNTLHPVAEVMLEVEGPDPWDVAVAEQRKHFHRRLRDIGGPLAPVASIETLSAEKDGRRVPLTLYRPQGAQGPLPLFVYIHGGGWVVGEHDQYHALCTRIAAGANCAVASIGYSLSPEETFPTGLQDCQLAYEWLLADHEWQGLDPNRVVIGGDSAGGNLSAAMGILATQGLTPSPLGLWLVYPVTDLLAETPSRDLFDVGFGLDGDIMRWFGQQYLAKGEDEAAQVLVSPGRMNEATAAAYPKTLIQTAGFDPLKDEAKDMASLLDGHDRLLAYTCYEEMTHGFINAFDLLSESQMAVDEGTLWLKRLFAN